MTHETGKSMVRRSSDSRFVTRYFVGDGIDIGAGDDSLANYQHMFPALTDVCSWDIADGDAMLLDSVADNSFDFVNSSHCLEHMQNPFWAMRNWVRVCKPGGYLVIVVPDFEQYEQGFWPSRFNADHKWCFSISGWQRHPKHLILMNEKSMFHGMDVRKIELVERGYNYDAQPRDQSLSVACEPAIEIVCRKL